MPIKINGSSSGSVTLAAPASGSDVTVDMTAIPQANVANLTTDLAAKLNIAGGKILQIVRATDSTDRSTTSTSYVDAGISVTITPQKSNSAVLLLWNVLNNSGITTDTSDLSITDSSNTAVSGAARAPLSKDANAAIQTVIGYATPATTSATTYKGRFRVTGGGTAYLLNNVNVGQLFAIEVSA